MNQDNEKRTNYLVLVLLALAIVILVFMVTGGESNEPTSGNVSPDQIVPR